MNFLNSFRRLFIFLFSLFLILTCSLTDAKASEKIGVLYSYKNVETYETNNIVGFQQLWKSFLETFEGTNLDYQFLCNISPDTKRTDLDVNIIFYPLAVDLDQNEYVFLKSFLESGGRLIISAGIGPASENLKSFLSEQGIEIKENVIAKSELSLKFKTDEILSELPVGNFYSVFDVRGSTKKILGRWKETSQPAVASSNNTVYLGYSWGQEVDRGNDVKIFLKTIDYFWENISFNLTKKISKEEFKKIVKEINSLKSEASLILQISEQLDLSVPKFSLSKHFNDGVTYLNNFNSSYLFGNYKYARENAESAKNEFALVYSLGIPVRKVEIRAIWLDRGTIVSMRDPMSLRNLIKNLAKIGFNVVFFETVNAGYPVYPSKLLPQNPLIKDWDPLKVAIEAAHANGIELHAWVWTFAVGNTRHNLLINMPVEYPGPIISTKDKTWTLLGKNGEQRLENQPELWISPANKKACTFLQELFTEIVSNYDVDGFQFDYIRFPFQKPESQAGFDPVTKNAFIGATGYAPALEGKVNRIWRDWKANLVSNFVKETSTKLKSIKPDLKISGAVFGIDRTLRMQLIQQDWESWLVNGWIDAVYPFYYSYTNEEIKAKLLRERQLINDKGIIIPAFNLRVLSLGDFAERITESRNAGVLGTALFAAEHLDTAKSNLLKTGPFREKAILTPYEKPVVACQKLLDEFNSIIEKFALTKKLSVLSQSETQKEVYFLTKELKNDFDSYTPEKANEIERKLTELQLKVKDWLSLEKYLDRDQRALYISSYLEQVRTILSYLRNKTVP